MGARDRMVPSRFVPALAVSYGEAALPTLASGFVGDCGLRRAFHAGVLALSGDQRPQANLRSQPVGVGVRDHGFGLRTLQLHVPATDSGEWYGGGRTVLPGGEARTPGTRVGCLPP